MSGTDKIPISPPGFIFVSSRDNELIQKTYIPGDTYYNFAFYTASDILQNLSEKYSLRSRLSAEKIGKALTKLGFQKTVRRRDSQTLPVYGYFVKLID